MLMFSRAGKLRLQKWYDPISQKEKKKTTRDLIQTILSRKAKMSNVLEWKELNVVYKRLVGRGGAGRCVRVLALRLPAN